MNFIQGARQNFLDTSTTNNATVQTFAMDALTDQKGFFIDTMLWIND